MMKETKNNYSIETNEEFEDRVEKKVHSIETLEIYASHFLLKKNILAKTIEKKCDQFALKDSTMSKMEADYSIEGI